MTQRDQIVPDICGEDSNEGEAQSTFDRLLREYFATFVVGELPTASGRKAQQGDTREVAERLTWFGQFGTQDQHHCASRSND